STILLPPPRPTLFPYTTLFRSLIMSMLALDSDLLRSAGIEIKRRDPSDGMRCWKSATLALENFRIQFERETQEKFFLIADERDRDRKSTRLNSSHRTISYAVFC